MILVWACGSIANIFESDSLIRKILSFLGNGVKNSIRSHSIPVFIGSIIGLVFGTIISVLLLGAFSPIMIIAYLIGIIGVKKQIVNNNKVLNSLKV